MEKVIDLSEKEFYKSKTFWANMAFIVFGVASLLAENYSVGIPVTFAGIVNAILRFKTNNGIVFKLE